MGELIIVNDYAVINIDVNVEKFRFGVPVPMNFNADIIPGIIRKIIVDLGRSISSNAVNIFIGRNANLIVGNIKIDTTAIMVGHSVP